MCVTGNADECCMTRIQEMSLNYHFAVEQKSGSSILGFFGFNGETSINMLFVCLVLYDLNLSY